MNKKKGFSLVIGLGVVSIMFMISLVSLFVVNQGSTLNRAILMESVTNMAIPMAIYNVLPDIEKDLPEKSTTMLAIDGPIEEGTIKYLYWDVNWSASLRDNNDADDNPKADTDERLILHIETSMDNGGSSIVEVLYGRTPGLKQFQSGGAYDGSVSSSKSTGVH